ncbi:A/G-specific adenine glycosylase, putative [Plasmodium ovale]|uniref:A/G-specific adenine glycosylase, putative n=1 Tax=Plasmodium ovale TaxID=36330 RepID=A0A1C3KSQ2_PLAOA|nr:A/G-specific adenine glycosylase, putative [Plasmodium ovale]
MKRGNFHKFKQAKLELESDENINSAGSIKPIDPCEGDNRVSECDAESEYHYALLRKCGPELKRDLLEWYRKYRRKLPWRNDLPPYTTSVQLHEEGKNSQEDIRRYFRGVDTGKRCVESISNKINEEKKTKVITMMKEEDNFDVPKLKRIKREKANREVNREENRQMNREVSRQMNREVSRQMNRQMNRRMNRRMDDTSNDGNGESSNLVTSYNYKPTNALEEEKVERYLVSDREKLILRGYEVYISEIMLQQTKVNTVLNYYIKWMNRWTNIFELAKSNLDDILIVWKGLGYYHRAKNLHECSKIVVNRYNGIFPKSLKLLKELPGIGDYTSKAICIHLYNRNDICIDTNIIRIFSRITETINYSNSTILQKHCQEVSNILCYDECNYSDLSQALMDLGSSICNNSPQCKQCPINKYCLIYLNKSKKKNNLSNVTHSDHCKLCVKDRNVEIKHVPLAKKKKKKKQKKYALS